MYEKLKSLIVQILKVEATQPHPPAGYDPHESIRFWERMERSGSAQPPEFLSTHPSHGHRIQQLQAWMPQAMEEYAKARPN